MIINGDLKMIDKRFKYYSKPAVQPMRPYEVGEDLTNISVSNADFPVSGGMIAVNPKDDKDMWYVSKAFFEENYILTSDTGGDGPGGKT